MEWLIVAIGVLVGGGTGAGITWGLMRNKPPQIIETNKVIEKMVEVDASLTETDLLKVPCSQEYIEKNSELLCREMFCRMNTRGGATQQTASSKECEAISNTLNKSFIYGFCKDTAKNLDVQAQEYDKVIKECIEFFDRRI